MLAKLNVVYGNKDLDILKEKVLPTLGDNIKYDEDTWVCNKKRKNPTDKATAYCLYFKNTPSQFKNLVKDYVVLSFSMNNGVAGIITTIKRTKIFLRFIDNIGVALKDINKEVAQSFKKYLSETSYKESYKNMIWGGIKTFFSVIKGLDNVPKMNCFLEKNPFQRDTKRHDNKYVPKYIIKQMDKAFRDSNIPLFIRVVYWVCRSIPSRIGEVLAMPIDCIKHVTEDMWVVFIPTWKQNGGYDEPQIRRVYFRDIGHGKFLKKLLEEQQEVAISLQDGIDDEGKKNLLLTRKILKVLNGTEYYLEDPTITMYDAVSRAFAKIIDIYNIKDEDGKLYNLTSHQLRHNGITDRLYHGFSLMQTSLLTEHQGLGMLQTAYNHPQKDVMISAQKSVQNKNENNAVYFRGRILNMDEATEKRLLQNIRTRRIKNLGICRDFTGCESFQCLACDNFIPNADDLPYYEEQIRIFEGKLIKVGEHKFLKENIEYNLNLYRKAIEKIMLALQVGGEDIETTSNRSK